MNEKSKQKSKQSILLIFSGTLFFLPYFNIKIKNKKGENL